MRKWGRFLPCFLYTESKARTVPTCALYDTPFAWRTVRTQVIFVLYPIRNGRSLLRPVAFPAHLNSTITSSGGLKTLGSLLLLNPRLTIMAVVPSW